MVHSKKTLCLITGASQFLGSHLAQAIAQVVAPGSTLILSSRSTERLEKVRHDIRAKVGDKVDVKLVQWDLRHPNAEQYEHDLKRALEGKHVKDYEVAVIIHNAAQLGDMKRKVEDMRNVQELQEQLNINLVSLLVLNSVWLSLVKHARKKVVVNMTAGSATTARPSLGLTTMVKSSRQLTLTVLAREAPDVQVLHFDPGAIDTDSLRAIRDDSHSVEIRDWIKGFYDRDEVLTAEHVVNSLLKTLHEDQFESGGYVSAYAVKH
jgi:sepiapterin reductase